MESRRRRRVRYRPEPAPPPTPAGRSVRTPPVADPAEPPDRAGPAERPADRAPPAGRAGPAERPADRAEPAGAEPAASYWPADADTGYAERSLRGLVGGGTSQVPPAAAMRARDAARPRPEDLARAEATLVVVRRHWTPREGSPPPPR